VRSKNVESLGGRWGNEEITRVSNEEPAEANGQANGHANGQANGKANGKANEAYDLRSEGLTAAAAVIGSRWGAEEVSGVMDKSGLCMAERVVGQ
jgi:hypothetical protein